MSLRSTYTAIQLSLRGLGIRITCVYRIARVLRGDQDEGSFGFSPRKHVQSVVRMCTSAYEVKGILLAINDAADFGTIQRK